MRSTEAAEMLGVSRNTVKKWARTGYLRLALFHGYLELAACAILFIQSPQPSAQRP